MTSPEQKLGVSPRASILADLRNEVNHLKTENKQLARQLHLDRYVAKHRSQRTINDLRSENLRLQRVSATMRDRANAREQQAVVHENVARIKGQETDAIRAQSKELGDKIGETATHIELAKQKNEELKTEIQTKNRNLENLKTHIKQAKENLDEEIALKKEISDAVQKTKNDTRKLQERHSSQQRESQRLDEAHSKVKQEIEMVEEDMDKARESIRKAETNFLKTEDEMRKLTSELRLIKERQATDSAKCSSLLAILHTESRQATSSQTDPLQMGRTTATISGDRNGGSKPARGTMVRVTGMGGNAKRNFGRGLELRATSYSRHVNLNVKLNK